MFTCLELILIDYNRRERLYTGSGYGLIECVKALMSYEDEVSSTISSSTATISSNFVKICISPIYLGVSNSFVSMWLKCEICGRSGSYQNSFKTCLSFEIFTCKKF